MNLGGVSITVNYPDDECEANVPSDMTVDQLCQTIRRLIESEKDMTSFVISAAIRRT